MTVTEGIRQVRYVTPLMCLNLALERGAGFHCSAQGRFKLRHNEIEMYRRPMSFTATQFINPS
jgi:hypothetical protein